MEAAGDGLFRNLKRGPRLRIALHELFHCLLAEIETGSGSIRLEVSAGAIAFNGVAPLRNLALEGGLWQRSALGQIDNHAVSGSFDVADVYQAGKSRGPQTRNRATTGIEWQMVVGALVKPPRRHHPGVLSSEIALLWSWNRRLVPGMAFIDGIAERIVLDEHLFALPIIVKRAAQQNAQPEINVNQIVGDQLAVHHDSRSDEHSPAPIRHVFVAVIADGRIVE